MSRTGVNPKEKPRESEETIPYEVHPQYARKKPVSSTTPTPAPNSRKRRNTENGRRKKAAKKVADEDVDMSDADADAEDKAKAANKAAVDAVTSAKPKETRRLKSASKKPAAKTGSKGKKVMKSAELVGKSDAEGAEDDNMEDGNIEDEEGISEKLAPRASPLAGPASSRRPTKPGKRGRDDKAPAEKTSSDVANAKKSRVTGTHRPRGQKYMSFNSSHYTLYDLDGPQRLPAKVTSHSSHLPNLTNTYSTSTRFRRCQRYSNIGHSC